MLVGALVMVFVPMQKVFLAVLLISTRNVADIRPMTTALTNYSPRGLFGTEEAMLGRLC